MKRGVKTSSKASGSIRIISGRWRGRKLPVLDVQGLRPTTDKNKEMLFNWLMAFTHNARCLDVFAGTGGLGFEALSRYAEAVTFIELDKKAASKLSENAALLGLSATQAKIIRGNALDVLSKQEQTYDLIFLDPPFNQNLLPTIIEIIVKQGVLAPNGVIYIECEATGGEYLVPDEWQCIKQKQSSQILSRLYQRV